MDRVYGLLKEFFKVFFGVILIIGTIVGAFFLGYLIWPPLSVVFAIAAAAGAGAAGSWATWNW